MFVHMQESCLPCKRTMRQVLAETDKMVIQNVPKAMMLAILGTFSLEQWDSLHKYLNLHSLTVPRTNRNQQAKSIKFHICNGV